MTQPFEKTIKQLKTLIEYRKTHLAPVDTMGCDITAEKINPKDHRFQILISLMLSSQTKDQMTHAAALKLQKIEGGFNAPNLMKADRETILSCISCVGFANRKTDYIREAAKRCHEKYDDDVPKTLKEFTEFKGVGIKMGTLAMARCWNEQIGIGVDVHVHRISNLLGWVKTNHPDETETALQKVLPKDIWPEVNHCLVGFGQSVCGSKKRKCEECPISSTCRYYLGEDTQSEEETEEEK